MDSVDDPLIRYRSQLLGYLLHLVRNEQDAEDLLQQVAAAVLENPKLLKQAGDPLAYLRGVARHLATGQFQTRMRDNQVLRRWTEWAWEADPGDGQTESQRLQQIEALRDCRGTLPDRTRTILELHYDHNYDLKTIASRMDLQTNAIKAVLFRARRALAECIRLRLAKEGLR